MENVNGEGGAWGANEGDANEGDASSSTSFLHAPARADTPQADALDSASHAHAPTRLDAPGTLPPVTAAQQYSLQFSTTEEHVQLIERAKALLARVAPGKSLGELHLQAMKLLVAALEKQKFGMTERPRNRGQQQTIGQQRKPQQQRHEKPQQQRHEKPQQQRQRHEKPQRSAQAPPAPQATTDAADAPVGPVRAAAAPRSRHVPAAVRREVFQRDGGRCSYVDERGERCRETRCLELHHRQPFGMKGDHAASNLTLHCLAHNALAAELDFGRQHVAEHRDPQRHASLASEQRALGGERFAPR